MTTPARAEPTRWARLTPRWITESVRNKLLAMALLPLLVVLPLLIGTLVWWGNTAYDRLLITKVRSDLAVARGYFEQVLAEVGSGTSAVAGSHQLHVALASQDLRGIHTQLIAARDRLDFDFINLYTPQGQLLTADWTAAQPSTSLKNTPLDAPSAAARPNQTAGLKLLGAPELLAMAPHLSERIHIPLIATVNASPTTRTQEDRALVMLSTVPVRGPAGDIQAVVRAGVLLNQNLDLIDHINHIVYPDGSLPLGSQGTATLFLEDVRIVTNVRLFQNQRAIGTRVSQAVRDTVLERGESWLNRAFVVNDWYVSAYEPLLDQSGQRVGMLYVGYLEAPFRQVKTGMLALIVGLFVIVIILAAAFSLRWARSIFKPVEQMNHAMQRVAEGETSARVGEVQARDEIGALANHLDQLLDVIDDKTRSLQEFADDLDAKVIARTRELAKSNTSLQQAQQQLVKSEKLAAIGQLTASVAHEINNPIAVIQGNLDLVRDLLGDQVQSVEAEFKLMDQQVDRMRLIVTQLLQHARPSDFAGYIESVDTQRALENSLVLVGHLLARTGITVVRDFQATQPVEINRQELQQVLVNLLINAIQAMPGGGTLLLRSRDQVNTQGAPGVTMQVADSGLGLSPEVSAQLFRPFFTTRPDGNGLGLWISVGLVERYGGGIEGRSRRDAGEDSPGTVFSIHLRRDGVSESNEAPSQAIGTSTALRPQRSIWGGATRRHP